LKACIRGIYSTALTKLLLDHGFQIVRPSRDIKERFGLNESVEYPDLDVYGRPDRQGVEAFGNPEATLTFDSILREHLDDVIIRRSRSSTTSVSEREYFLNVEFPALSKMKLDEARRLVVPTLEGHHRYKACGGSVSSAVDMAEKLLQKGRPPDEVMELFRRCVEVEYPTEGSTLDIEHVKLNGYVVNLGKGMVEEVGEASELRIRRVFDRGGVYDGLNVPKEAGDQAVTYARVNDLHLKTEYFSSDGCYKGTYINLNTPIELYPTGIRYVDLEVDVIKKPDGETKIIDEKKLEKAVKEGTITQRLLQMVRNELNKLLEGAG